MSELDISESWWWAALWLPCKKLFPKVGLVILGSSYHVAVHVYFTDCLKFCFNWVFNLKTQWKIMRWALLRFDLGRLWMGTVAVCWLWLQCHQLIYSGSLSLFTHNGKMCCIFICWYFNDCVFLKGSNIPRNAGRADRCILYSEACNAFPSLPLKCTHQAPISILKLLYCRAHLCIKVMNS